VTLQVTTPDELSNLVVEDWLPGGLEALDPNTDGGADGGRPLWPWLGGCAWWWRCTSWSRETHKDAVVFYAAWAHAGTHTLAYEAIAATRGTFALPPTKAAAALEPELMGLSAGGSLLVADGSHEVVALPRDASAHQLVRRCPRNCAGRGTCDGATGICACDADAAGDDCTATRRAPTIGAANANDSIAVLTGATQPHIVLLPLHCPASAHPSAPAQADAPPPSVPPPPPPESARHLYVLSFDEAQLPSSALHLSAPAPSRLELAVSLRRVTTHTCVRVTVAASGDGLLFGSRVLALWLSPAQDAGAADPPPPSCVGDGEGYQPVGWDAFVPTTMQQHAAEHSATVSPMLAVTTVSAILVVAVLLAARLVRSKLDSLLLARTPRSNEYPEPTESPGSQSGCFPAIESGSEEAEGPGCSDTTELVQQKGALAYEEEDRVA